MIPENFFTVGEDRPEGADILDTDAGMIDGYRVVYLRVATGWNAYSPDVSVFAGGDTREAAEATMREAITFHVRASAQDRIASASGAPYMRKEPDPRRTRGFSFV